MKSTQSKQIQKDFIDQRLNQMVAGIVNLTSVDHVAELSSINSTSSIYTYSQPDKSNIPSVNLLLLQHRAAEEGIMNPAELSVPRGYRLVKSDLPEPTGNISDVCWMLNRELVQFEIAAQVSSAENCYRSIREIERLSMQLRSEVNLINQKYQEA